MTPSRLHESVIAGRVEWVKEMIGGIRALPLRSYEEFTSDSRSPAAAESYLRRGLEAILDLGRHILAKGIGRAVPEYKDIARELENAGVIAPETAETRTSPSLVFLIISRPSRTDRRRYPY